MKDRAIRLAQERTEAPVSVSVFCSLTTETVRIPHDDAGATVTIRKLTPKELQAAMRAQQRAALESLSLADGALDDAQRRALAEVKPETVRALIQADPLTLYDRLTLVREGIVSWDYPRDPREPAVIEDLDEEALEFLARAILRLTKPALFLADARDVEAVQKNG